jgi:xylulokinase
VPLVGGIDSSTTATKIEIRDADDGRVWGRGSRPHPPTLPPRSEQDPAAWWGALVQAWHDAGRYDAAAVSVAGQQHGLVVLDEEANVLRPAKLWNDTESAPDADALVAALGAEHWAEACGSVPVPSFTVTKLAWLKRVEPSTFARVRHVLLPHDWLTWRLTGRLVTDRGDASGTGYWSPREGRWRTDLLRAVDDRPDWQERLPTVLAPAEPAGPLSEDAALPLNLDSGDVIVAPGTGDNMAAALGVGLTPGDVLVSIGTSGTVMSVSERPTADPSGIVAGFADATGRWLPLVCTLNATKVTDAVARVIGVEDRDAFDALVLSVAPGAGGVVCVPWFDGERTPNRPSATGTFLGLRSDVSPGQVARAAVEGVVCGLLEGLDALRAAVGADSGLSAGGRMVLVGGAARSAAYRQVLADLAGRPVVTLPPDVEPVALGAAVQAAAVLHECAPEDVSAGWGLGRAWTTTDPGSADVSHVRAAYRAAAG